MATCLKANKGVLVTVFYIATIITSPVEYPLHESSFKLRVAISAQASEINYSPSITLTLVGTVASNNGKALALLLAPGSTLKFYALGDNIEGYTLTDISPNSITLTKEKKLFTLYLQDKTLIESSPSNAQTSTIVPTQTNIVINKKLLNHIRNNPQAWVNAISMRLEMSDGLVSGYFIESIRKIPFQANIGLKKGDIIKAVNGVSIGQPQLFAKTVNNLMNVSDMTIQVERNHKLHLLNFNIQD